MKQIILVALIVSIAITGCNNKLNEKGDLAYWNGFDFGQNLTYEEKYEHMGDSGEYLNAAESAKLTFDIVRDNGNIPEYSDDTEYKMIFVDIKDIESEECYVYVLDIDEPTGTKGAAYAFAYQSGNIYMEGYGSQWVMIINAKNEFDMDIANWLGEYINEAENKSLIIGHVDINQEGISYFNFLISTMDGDEFEGTAAISEEKNIAEYMDLEFVLSDDNESVIINMIESRKDKAEREMFVDIYYRSEN